MAQEESMESSDVTQIIKGKRTKRQRSSSPYKVALTSSSSSGGGEGGRGRGRGVVVEEYGCSSPTTSSGTRDQVCESTEEEEYMANCLILLAQGDGPRPIEKSIMEKFSGQKFSVMATPNITKASFYVYQCKTCNRSFPSFQALGGHRASHKRPKAVAEEKKPPVAASMDDHEDCQVNKSCSDLMISLETANNKGFHHGAKAKVHECSICGSEFTSGQALGGHMRRHRAAGATTNKVDSSVDNTSIATIKSNVIGDHDHHQIKPRSTLALDLNLPAPEDDHHHRESKFQLLSTQQVLVFSAPALVDCHY